MKYDTICFIGLTYRPGTKSPHLVTQRINHRYSFLFSHRKTQFSPEETGRYLICIIPDEIQDFLWLLKYWGRGSFRETLPQSMKKKTGMQLIHPQGQCMRTSYQAAVPILTIKPISKSDSTNGTNKCQYRGTDSMALPSDKHPETWRIEACEPTLNTSF